MPVWKAKIQLFQKKQPKIAKNKPERHASAGPLTDKEIKSAKPWTSDYQMAEPGGLRIIIKANGAKWWRFRYRFRGVEKQISMGVYPDVSLADARKACNEARLLIARDHDPPAQRKLAKHTNFAQKERDLPTFEKVAREWFSKNEAIWSPKHGRRTMMRLEKYLFPFIGNVPIADLKTVNYVQILSQLERLDHIETAKRVGQLCGQITRYARAIGILEYDTAGGISQTVKKVKTSHFATITSPEEFGHLLASIDEYNGSPSTYYALRIMPYVFVRSSELRGARWKEIDFENAEWTISGDRMKMKRPHIVPLAPQVIELFSEMEKYSGQSELVFPGYASKNRCITDVALLNALRRLGYDRGQMTVHGFRSAASTMLNEMGYNRDWIEMQLAHAEKNVVRAAYNRAQWLLERKNMMCEWANYIDSLKEKARNG